MSNQQVLDPPALDALAAYKPVRAAIEQMKRDNDRLVFDITDPKQEKAARSHIAKMRTVKGDIERQRKDLKAGALEYGRKVDAVAKELTGEVEAMIAVHQEPLDRRAKEEEERQQAIEQAIQQIKSIGAAADYNTSSKTLASMIESLEGLTLDQAVYQERYDEAVTLHRIDRQRLTDMLTAAGEREQQAAELERLRREKEQRDREDHERRIAEEARQKAERDAQARLDRERQEAEQREQRLKQQAEQARIDAERKVREAEEARRREEQVKQAAEQKRLADAAHVAKVKSSATQALVESAEISQDKAMRVIDAIQKGLIPGVWIAF